MRWVWAFGGQDQGPIQRPNGSHHQTVSRVSLTPMHGLITALPFYDGVSRLSHFLVFYLIWWTVGSQNHFVGAGPMTLTFPGLNQETAGRRHNEWKFCVEFVHLFQCGDFYVSRGYSN